MGSKLTIFTGGLILGMGLLMYEPSANFLKKISADIKNKIDSKSKEAVTSIHEAKIKVNQFKDSALDTMEMKIDELIKVIDDIDISKLKGKSKSDLENVKLKLLSLKTAE